MKRYLLTFCVAASVATALYGQSSSGRTSGKITYEGMRQIDFSQMRGNGPGGGQPGGNGPGGAESSEGTPEVITFTQKLIFSGTMAKEERDRPQNRMRLPTGAPGQTDGQPDNSGSSGEGRRFPRNGQRMRPPFEQTTFLDLANRQRIDVLTIKQDSASQTYRSEKPMPAASDWKTSDKTKKIAGYVCHKATATHRKQTYTIWYTTDLPFAYSPVVDLTPPTGVVLQIESDNESYKATGISTEAVAEADVQPSKEAKVISPDEMEQVRRKAMASFRQKMMQNMPFPDRN